MFETNSPFRATARSDEELAELCRKRDESAFAELMRRYLRQIYAFAYQYGRSPEDTEDIVQDTFYKTWKYIDKYAAGKQFRPWLYTIARNTALDFLKKKKSAPFSDLDDDENDLQFADTIEDESPLQPEIFETAAYVSQLQFALQDLHPDHRAVLMLHYKDDMTFEEIATVVGKPMNTIKSWHRRALLKLRTKFVSQV